MKKNKYCIFNKQYSKEEYKELRAKIIKHMDDMPYTDEKGRIYKYGEFFSFDMSPFAANETNIMDFTDISKETALSYGLKWRNPKPNEYKMTIKALDLPDHIKDAGENVTKEIIECSSCKKAYRIVPKELDFYKRMNIPLPHKDFECRHQDRMKKRNPRKLWHRSCMCELKNHVHAEIKCQNEFETAYSTERTEKIYCENCYQQEVS